MPTGTRIEVPTGIFYNGNKVRISDILRIPDKNRDVILRLQIYRLLPRR